MSATYPLVAVFADESCLGNGKSGDTPGGLGALIEFRRADGAVQRFDLWASEPDTTNNRMALRSVIDSYQAMSATDRVTLRSWLEPLGGLELLNLNLPRLRRSGLRVVVE